MECCMKLSAILFLLFTTMVQAEVKPHMQEFFSITSRVQPYLLNKKEFLDAKNEVEIQKSLTEFKEKTAQLKKDKLAQSDDMKFRARQLSEGLEEAEQSFKNGFKDYSYWVLKSSFQNCFSCHTQKSLGETSFKFSPDKKASNFANAEFLFIVRNYSEAVPLLEKIVAEYPGQSTTVEELESSIQKILYYSVRVLRDDVKTGQLFERLLKNEKLPSSVRNNLLAWQSYLKVKKYRIADEIKVEDQKSLQIFLDERETVASHYKLSRQRYIVDLETGHYLFQWLENSKNKDLKPWLLYGIANLEKDYRSSMFDLTVENYLKECIEVYSKSNAAKKCLTLYKDLKKDAYTGSRGTDIPKSVQDQLNKYDNLINKK